MIGAVERSTETLAGKKALLPKKLGPGEPGPNKQQIH